MSNTEFVRRKLQELAELRRTAVQRQLAEASLGVPLPMQAQRIDMPTVDLVLTELTGALRDMGRIYPDPLPGRETTTDATPRGLRDRGSSGS